MLEKSSIFLMLLLGAGSFFGISSYKPVNVEAQPQPQEQLLPPTAQQQQPAQTQENAQKPVRSIGISPERRAQIAEDKALLDRIFPQIIERIDGKMLAQKVLPYLDISASVRQANGPTSILKVGGGLGLNTALEPRSSAAQCNKGEIPIGGGFSFRSDPEDSYVSSVLPTQQNGWTAGALMGDNGEIKAYAACLTVKVALKSPAATPVSPAWKSLAQQQGLTQQLQPSQPPGAPPQQPPGGPIIK